MIIGVEKAEMIERKAKFLKPVLDYFENKYIWVIIGIYIGFFITLPLVQTKIEINNYIPLFGTLVGAFVGAWSAFKLNQLRELKKEKQEHVSAGNNAIFTLYQMWESLSAYKSEVLDPFRGQDNAWLIMKVVYTEQYSAVKIDIDRAGFLLDTKFSDVCRKLYIAQTKYNVDFVVIRKRTELFLDTVSPKIERMEIEGIDISNHILIEKKIGKSLSLTLKEHYKNIVLGIETDIPYITQTYNELRNAMKSLYPEAEILEFSLE